MPILMEVGPLVTNHVPNLSYHEQVLSSCLLATQYIGAVNFRQKLP